MAGDFLAALHGDDSSHGESGWREYPQPFGEDCEHVWKLVDGLGCDFAVVVECSAHFLLDPAKRIWSSWLKPDALRRGQQRARVNPVCRSQSPDRIPHGSAAHGMLSSLVLSSLTFERRTWRYATTPRTATSRTSRGPMTSSRSGGSPTRRRSLRTTRERSCSRSWWARGAA